MQAYSERIVVAPGASTAFTAVPVGKVLVVSKFFQGGTGTWATQDTLELNGVSFCKNPISNLVFDNQDSKNNDNMFKGLILKAGDVLQYSRDAGNTGNLDITMMGEFVNDTDIDAYSERIVVAPGAAVSFTAVPAGKVLIVSKMFQGGAGSGTTGDTMQLNSLSFIENPSFNYVFDNLITENYKSVMRGTVLKAGDVVQYSRDVANTGNFEITLIGEFVTAT